MSTPTNPEVKELNPVDFIQLQQYIEYCSLKVKDVLMEFDADGSLAQHRHGECINEEGFRLFLKTYLEEEDFPVDLCQRLFRSFQNSEPTQEDSTSEIIYTPCIHSAHCLHTTWSRPLSIHAMAYLAYIHLSPHVCTILFVQI